MENGTEQKNIRNFAIIAHVDHGKSTLADRILDLTGAVAKREMREQFLDSLDLERERGITIKLKAIRLNYQPFDAAQGKLSTTNYQLNLIDTPGHVDFGYEVSRSLAACEGAVLIVDASQGIQAQTAANYFKAKQNGLKIVPFINKIDLLISRPAEVGQELMTAFGFRKEEILWGSGKTGQGVEELLAQIIRQIPPPTGRPASPLRALVFDSHFDEYKGVVAFVKIVDGGLDFSAKTPVKFLATKAQAQPLELGFLSPEITKVDKLKTGEVGYVATGLKDISQVRVGDTITKLIIDNSQWTIAALPGYQEPKPMVFLGLYPTDAGDFLKLRKSLEKLKLSDASIVIEAESSEALGLGFRCGFLGLLHAEIVQERLERDYGLNLISTSPSVFYHISLTDGRVLEIHKASDLPDPSKVREIAEPYVKLFIYCPQNFTGAVLRLLESYRAIFDNPEYVGEVVRLVFEVPLSEIIIDFYDKLKSVSMGFASLDYELLDFRVSDLCRLDVLVAGKVVEPLAQIVPRVRAQDVGRKILVKLKETINPHQFVVVLQAAIGGPSTGSGHGKIVAREEISALRKNVLAKMSGGHRERKDKLLDRQKVGKKRLKQFGQVEIPQAAFRVVLER